VTSLIDFAEGYGPGAVPFTWAGITGFTTGEIVSSRHFGSAIDLEKLRRFGGGVWESNPPFVPLRNGSPALKAGKITGLFSPPRLKRPFAIIEQCGKKCANAARDENLQLRSEN
jgi:hypothetical protein